ncbi:uncharacterized protein [Apostichopus japonicus]|uniref:uncharacterized protein isoform X2 n=1 Tax=Stichopus japonicus TaxID=307972 RepID=UPI003AB37475
MTDIGQTVKDATRRLKAFTANNDFEISQGLVNELGEIYEAHTNHDENGQTKIVHAFDSEDGADVIVRIVSILSKKEDELTTTAQKCFRQCYNILWDFSDTPGNFVKHLMNTCIVRQCIENLRTGSKSTSNKGELDLIRQSLGILYNISRDENAADVFDEDDLSFLLPYKEGDDEYLKALSAMILAFLSDEKINGIQGEKDTTEYMVKLLRGAKHTAEHRKQGLSCTELIDGITRLVLNDSNKETVREVQGVSLLMEFVKGNNLSEQEAAAKCLWTLSFSPSVQQELKSFMEELDSISCDDGSKEVLTKMIKGILLTLKSSEQNDEIRGSKESKGSHIMVSYSWDGGNGEKRARNIARNLKSRGFKVWIDVDEMTGSLLDAMAEAVNNSYLFILCVSDGYRKSNNCRLEAKYANGQKKVLLPVLVDSTLTSRKDWLAFLCSDMLYVDFREDNKFHSKCEELANQIHRLTGETDETDTSQSSRVLKRSNTLAFSSNAGDWGPEDVSIWLRENDLQGLACSLEGADGNTIAALRKMRREAPEFFYRSLWECDDKFKAQKLMMLLKFTRAMDQL